MWAIIGGTGFERFSDVKVIEELDRKTPFGFASNGLKKIQLDDNQLVFLPRHGAHHELLPTEVNYRANIFALKKLGVTKILSISSVGSLREELKRGDMVVPSQYINRTFIPRNHTFCGEGIVGHVSLAKPISAELVNALHALQEQLPFKTHFNKTYVCIEGPYFSTQAESHHYRQMGADIVGMSNFPEYALAREAGIHYLPCTFVTDFDSWNQDIPHVTLEQVMQIISENNANALQLAKTLVLQTYDYLTHGCEDLGLAGNLLCKPETLSAERKEWLSILIGKKI